ncbi:MAG TPA: sulfotransferase [Chitinophagaceae bacterium]|nr:sulfotransferase [Chitinophagaceae bacterium]
MYPNFIIIGPPKCASTSLHFYLGQHPEIFTSKIKETKFFSQHYKKGLAYYARYFKDAGNAKAIGEATPVYSFLPFVADHIKEHFPDIKLIICFRNPLDRTFSSWLMQKGMGKEKLLLREAIEINRKQMGYITLEGEEGEKKWLDSMGIYNADESRLRTYIQAGMFAATLKSYYKRFHPEQIKIVFLDDLKSDFDGTMSSLFRFLGVKEDFIIPNKEVVNFHFDRKANKITNKLFGIKGTRFLIDLTPKFIKNKLKKSWKPKELPKLEMEDRLYLWEVFKDDVAELEKMVGRDLSQWNPTIKKPKVVTASN